MDRIVILGAGEVGGLLAHAVARHHVADHVDLIDDNGRAAEGKALDITQAAAIEGFAATTAGKSDLSLVGGANAVVIADPFAGGERTGETALALLRRVDDFAPRSPIVCVGAPHRELVERGVRELKIARSRLLGSAPEALASAIRALVAAELQTSPHDISLTALGVPPEHIVVPWEDATLAGFALRRVISEPAWRRINDGIDRLWPPGPYALASAAARILHAILGRSQPTLTCFVAPDDSSGRRSRAAALPVRLGSAGIVHVATPELSGRDRVRLDNAMLL